MIVAFREVCYVCDGPLWRKGRESYRMPPRIANHVRMRRHSGGASSVVSPQ